jgi:SagB-type dehydrogenase family enzyme
MANPANDAALDPIHAYHQRTKHRFDAYAPSPGFLDWTTQPDPFRRFTGAPVVPLPLAAERRTARYAELFEPAALRPQPFTAETVAVLLELSFGLSAWKQYENDRWALRCNPSSGNLHPTEVYAVVAGVANLPSGIYHYASREHALEQRCAAALPFQGLLIGLSSVHWREEWKYGERAFRYCQHDVGHALGALRYAAGVSGWTVELLEEWGDDDIAALLGLDRDGDFAGAEPEVPDLLCRIRPQDLTAPDAADIDGLVRAARAAGWQGRANVLSPKHRHQWPAIEAVASAARKPRTAPSAWRPSSEEPLLPTRCELAAAELIKQRRSAQAFDGATHIAPKAFYRLLDATLPHHRRPPFDAWPWPPRVHLVLFVHRVHDVPPGLYLFCRTREAAETLRGTLRNDLLWNKVGDCPAHFELYCLARANAKKAAKTLSCHQDIAADGAFSLGMLAEFDSALEDGPWVYRRLFWETGLIGQALYLEAEAAGVRGTGIGCFFDDPVHELLGLGDTRVQSLYHFTVGSPLTDARLQTLPPYGHLPR